MRSSPSELEKPHTRYASSRTRPQISAESASSVAIRGLCGEPAGRGRGPEPQVTTRLSPSTLIVFSGSGLGAGGFTTDPSVIEYLLP